MNAIQINLADTPDFDLGGLRISPAHRQVRFNGERRELEPKVVQVLVALAAARPDVVSRDRLIEQCWDGRIVGDDALNRCIVALRHLAKEFSPEPFAIETVPRVGYSLIERPEIIVARTPVKIRIKVMVGALLAVLVIAAAFAFGWLRPDRVEAAPASIAVMSFRNLSDGDPYFAEGIGEEILGQLSREPQFRVAGHASSSQFGKEADVRKVGQSLNVDYVLEGSVRTQGDRVRVSAHLVKASDGIRLWSDSYDGNLDDIFAIQQRIGGAIASALRRKLVQAPALSGPLVTNGEAYNLYLTARGLLRTRKREVGRTAADLLRDVIKLDPGYAPGWASLAAATQLEGVADGHEGLIAAIPRSQAYAEHALRLAPDLPEAHIAMGTELEVGAPEAQAHFRRAAELEPNRAENMIWLGVVHRNAGEYEAELAAYRRAIELDPLWFRTVAHLMFAVAEMGNRADAEAVVRRGHPSDENLQHLQLGRVAWIFGDFSEAARRWSIVAEANSPRWANFAERALNDARFTVGLSADPLVAVPAPNDRSRMGGRVRMDAAPAPPVWRARNRDRVAANVYRDENHVAAKLMLEAGRTPELAAAYDSAVGLLGLRRGQPVRIDQLGATPVVALALRRAGRASEADQLLREGDARVREVYRRGRVPFWFDVDAAAIFAGEGKTNDALSLLERAMSRGWRHNSSAELPDIIDEPAFRLLHDQPRFNRIRARLAAHYARERQETLQLRI